MNTTPGRRRIRRVSVWAGLLTVLVVLAGLPIYVRPQVDPLRRADAILVLGGPDHSRYDFGRALVADGWAPTMVISNPDGPHDRWLTRYCAVPKPGFTLICFSPDPATTKGEGRELRRLAAENGWRTVIVVTLLPHISRSRLILQRCFDGELVMAAIPTRLSAPEWAFHYVYQSAGYVRAVVQPGC
jgi:hypothetical protein